MPFISKKKSVFIFFCGLAAAAGTAFLLNHLLAGPRLGAVYDFFLNRRPPQPVSREILIIETGEFTESGDVFSVLMALTEFEAANLILETRVLGSSSPVTATEAEIRRRFNDEYMLLSLNIRNLFEAIRSGSVLPSQAPGYVDHLVELTEHGRDRLVSALFDRDEDLLRAANAFGSFTEAANLKPHDRDGKLRRVHPFEHPVYDILKSRYASAQIESAGQRQILLLEHDGNELKIPLDRDGNILAAMPINGFRRIDASLFREYEEAGHSMRRVLKEAGEAGAFSQTVPERSPLILGDYAFDLREEMLKSPDPEKRAAWIAAHTEYIESLDDFLYGPAEMILVSGYEKLIADESVLKEEGLEKLRKMRDEMIRSFNMMREAYREFARLYGILRDELASSFCIMGPDIYSALLANTLITANHVKLAADLHIYLWAIGAAFLIMLIVSKLRPVLALLTGLGLCVLAASAFGWSFTLSAYWIDPAIIFGASLAGTLVVFSCKDAIIRRGARCFRTAYGPAVSQDLLRELIRQGNPQVYETIVTGAAVIVIKDPELLGREEKEEHSQAVKAVRSFHSAAKEILFDAGAVIAGFEGDTIIACFGSPLDKTEDPAAKACALVTQLLLDKHIKWRFGMAAGMCAFSWSPETGYSVNGRSVVHARVLASKTARFNVRALMTGSIRKKIKQSANKIGALHGENDSFYEFPA